MFSRTIVKSLRMSYSKGMSVAFKTTGVVRQFDSVKGYGFLTPDDGSSDVFVHQSAIYKEGFRSLKTGEPVEFDVEINEDNSKRFAVNVTGPNGSEVEGETRQRNDRQGGGGGGGRPRRPSY